MRFECQLEFKFHFIYQTAFHNGLMQNELDHLLFGRYKENPVPNPAEAEGWKWMNLTELSRDLITHPQEYTFWLRYIWEEIRTRIPSSD